MNALAATYRGIEDAITGQVRILVQTMVGLAKSDARAAASDGTGVDGVKAAEERRGPFCGSRWVGDAGRVLGRGGSAVHPAINIELHL